MLLAACSDEEDRASPGKRALDCAALLPGDLIAAHLPGAELEPVAPTETTALCRLRAGARSIDIGYTCVGDPAAGVDRAVSSASTGVDEIPKVGRGAYRLSYGPSAPTVTLLVADDDTDCWLSASAPVEHDHGALARDLAAALTPEALKAER